MKRALLTAISIFVGLITFAQTGTWSGKIDVHGTPLELVFNLSEGEEATLDVPDQGARGIKASVTRTATGGIKISVPTIGASFEGIYIAKMISGTFSQSGLSLPLNLKPGATKINRPQTPVGPFPYETEEVSFTNGDAVLKGTLTKPQGWSKDTPAVVMVTGSGLQNRDEEIYEHKPFAVIADYLARAGIATLRYDDRGFGESTGDLVEMTVEDMKNDALAGVTLLRNSFDKVGVLGHSEGGTFALYLAAEGKVDFAISLAGMAISGAETLARQNRDALLKAGLPEAETEEYVRLLNDTYKALTSGSELPVVKDYRIPDGLVANYQQALAQLNAPYTKSFLALDARTVMPAIKCPVLAINGTMDTQVDYKINLGAIEEGIKNKLTAVRLGGLNHLFQHCTTGQTDEYKQIEETFAPVALEEIKRWFEEEL